MSHFFSLKLILDWAKAFVSMEEDAWANLWCHKLRGSENKEEKLIDAWVGDWSLRDEET